MRRAAEKVIQRWGHMCVAPAFSALRERAAGLKAMRIAGTKVVLRWQRLGLWRGFVGWGEHAAQQRRLTLAAEKTVRRWISLVAGRTLSGWTRYTEEKKRLVRASERVVLRLQNVRLASAWVVWQEAWEEEVEALRRQQESFEDARTHFKAAELQSQVEAGRQLLEDEKRRRIAVVHRCVRSMLHFQLALAFHAFVDAIRYERRYMSKAAFRCSVIQRTAARRQRQAQAESLRAWRDGVVSALNDSLAAAKTEKDAMDRHVGLLKDKLKERSRRVVEDILLCDLASSFRLFQRAVEQARWHEQFAATQKGHECVVQKLSEELETEISHAQAVASKERLNRLAAVQHVVRLQRRTQLSRAFGMFSDAVFQRIEYTKMVAKVIETRGISTLDVVFMSFQRWIQLIHLHHTNLCQGRVQQAQADLRVSEEENAILAAHSAELEEKLAQAAREAERLELRDQESQRALALAKEDQASAHSNLTAEHLKKIASERLKGDDLRARVLNVIEFR